MSKALSDAWVQTEFPSCDVNVSKLDLISLFRQCDPQKLMDEEEYAMFANLNSELEIYRGTCETDIECVKSLSWTISPQKASWFANRWHTKGYVFKAKIRREHVLACFLRRGEEEVIVDPKHLNDIKIHPDLTSILH
ncbi:hypothetical protein [Agathobaculum desmolans]|uniref:hypothetical protein n=1 Tax=Agathobaculum desmolans TaxID=39484 RepID=UPI00248DF01A|nr:hypothetical protein [Agathobaculum desmolans]